MNDFIREVQTKTGWSDGNIIQVFIDFIYNNSLTEDCQDYFNDTAVDTVADRREPDKLSFQQWCELNGYLWTGYKTNKAFITRAKQYEQYLNGA
jgi:hypothetical protein